MNCPNCNSERVRRGGWTIWTIYLVLLGLALPAVLVFHLNAAIIAGAMVAVIVIANLALGERVCMDCGNQWRE